MKHYTKEEAIRIMEIQKCKRELADLDRKTLKFIDGDITAEEYEPFKKRRAELREMIREKENIFLKYEKDNWHNNYR